MSDQTIAGQEATEKVLEHYGVKGMKWGVRKSGRVEVSRRKVTGGLKAKGGEGRKPSADAKRAKVYGQVAKKSGYQALSNKQIKAYIERQNLEMQAKKIDLKNDTTIKFINFLLKTAK